MSYVAVTGECCVIIRRRVLDEKAVDEAALAKAMDGIDVAGRSADVISYGPLFGPDVLSEIASRLRQLGLEEIDDFFAFDFMLPPWLKLGADLAER